MKSNLAQDVLNACSEISGKNELNKYTIEVFNGQPEKPQFCHFNDVDNNHDYNFRISRNIKTAQIIVKILKNNLSELDDYLKL